MGWPYQQKPPMGWPLDYNSGLVPNAGFWPFLEVSGNTVQDLSGNGNDGIFDATNPPVGWVAGKFDLGISFGGGSDNINTGTGIFERGYSQLTVVSWAKGDNVNSGANETILSNHGGGVDDTVRFRRTSHTPARSSIGISTAGGEVFGCGPDVPDTNWHQWVGVYDGANVTTYIDTVPGSPSAQTGTTLTSDNNLCLGYDGDSWNGIIDHIMIYNHALSIFEIALLYRYPFWMFKDPAEIALLGGYQGAPPATIVPQIQYLRNMGLVA